MRGLLLRLLILPPILLGGLVLAWLVASREAPQRHPVEELSRAVRVVTVPELAVVPRVVGHGVVEPSRVWEAVAEVEGRVVEEHPQLERGALLAAGSLLLRLDASDYELRLAQAEAAIEAQRAQQAELARREANIEASLAIERRALELGGAELARKQELLRRGALSQATVDQEERQVLALRQAVQNLENALALLPAEARLLEAQIRQREAERDTARLERERTAIRLPFDARISQINVRRDQFASRGQVLVVADAVEAAEITARFPLDRMRRLMLLPEERIDLRPETVASTIERLGLRARVRLRAGRLLTEWDARVERISETVDPATRSAGVIVVVDEPYGGVIPGRRPPLVKNMFVEVELRGRPLEPLPVVPRTAVEAGRVLVVDDDERLVSRPVEIAFEQGAIAVIASGLAGGERVVVSDLSPAIEGMRLAPQQDDALQDALVVEANGLDDAS